VAQVSLLALPDPAGTEACATPGKPVPSPWRYMLNRVPRSQSSDPAPVLHLPLILPESVAYLRESLQQRTERD